jgi:hypothetical protein
MAVQMRRKFSGAWRAHTPGDGTWRITASHTAAQVIVIGADSGSVQACGTMLHDLGIEWRGQDVRLTMMCAGREMLLEASGAIVHEPAPDLYAGLPLADFDARARRFWRSVFLMVRIPGGRRLLGLLAHASRDKP